MTRIIRISCTVICIAITLVMLDGQLQAAGPRNWKNKEGKKIHASFVDLVVKKQDGTESEIIILERSSDKRVFEIPLKLLSELDQKITRKYLKRAESKKRKEEAQPKTEQKAKRKAIIDPNRKPPENGPYVEYYENGKKKSEGHFKDGKKDGLWTRWHKNGQKEYEEHYKNGKQHGLETYWYQNSQKLLEVHWKDGEKDGLETWWDEDGRKIIEVQYKGGEEVSHKEF